MKKPASRPQPCAVALALTWDGARCPVRSLPAKARAFLRAGAVPVRGVLGRFAASEAIREIRVCWVPQLKGGDDVLADSFITRTGKRITFRVARTVSFGDVFGVVYRRSD